jgi:hypothetical protein
LAYLRPEAVREHERFFDETTKSVSHAGKPEVPPLLGFATQSAPIE